MFAFTPTAPVEPTDMVMSFHCTNTNPAGVHPGVNTLFISASTTPVPDIVAMAATLGSDGIVNIAGPDDMGVSAVATVNMGIGATTTLSADTGGVGMPLALLMCQNNPETAQCSSAIAPTVTTQANASATPTFGAFVALRATVGPL